MCSQKSEDISDDSQQSFIDTEGLSRGSSLSSPATLNQEMSEGCEQSVSSSEDSFSPESPASSDLMKQCKDENETKVDSLRLKSPSPKRKRVNYESVCSLSVSSFPDAKSKEVLANNQLSKYMPCLSSFRPQDNSRNASIKFPNTIIMSKSETACLNTDMNSNSPSFRDNNSNKVRHNSTLPIEGDGKKVKSHLSIASNKTKLSFGIDRILSDENSSPDAQIKEHDNSFPSVTLEEPSQDHISKMSLNDELHESIRQLNLNHFQHQHYQSQIHAHHHHHHHNATNSLNLSRCTECYFINRYCRNNGNLQYTSPLVNTSSPVAVNVGAAATGGPGAGVSAPFPSWMSSSIYENSPLLSPSAYHQQSVLSASYGLNASNFSTISSLVACNSGAGGRRKRSWSRAVFSSLQRKGLEKRFQIQKYITKPDRRQLAATLGLTDAQVKVWFQNRRMKWRHSKEGKVSSGVGDGASTPSSTTSGVGSVSTTVIDKK